MVLQPADLTPGARVTKQGYKEFGHGLVGYEREFGGATTASGARLVVVYSEADLAASVEEATAVFAAVKVVVRSSSFRQQFVRQVIQSAGRRAHVRPRDIRFGPVRSLGVGDDSALVPVTVQVRRVRFSADMMFMRVDRGLGNITLIGVPRAPISLSDATTLAGKMAAEMRSGLAPLNTVAPMITGTATQGQALVVTTGAWSNNPTSFSYLWERCDPTGANCVPIAGAGGPSYTVTSADAASTIRASVTATNAVGSSTPATTTPTGVVR